MHHTPVLLALLELGHWALVLLRTNAWKELNTSSKKNSSRKITKDKLLSNFSSSGHVFFVLASCCSRWKAKAPINLCSLVTRESSMVFRHSFRIRAAKSPTNRSLKKHRSSKYFDNRKRSRKEPRNDDNRCHSFSMTSQSHKLHYKNHFAHHNLFSLLFLENSHNILPFHSLHRLQISRYFLCTRLIQFRFFLKIRAIPPFSAILRWHQTTPLVQHSTVTRHLPSTSIFSDINL